MMNPQILEALVCPQCKGALTHDRDASELLCHFDHKAYPIRDGILYLEASHARDLPAAS